MQRAVEISWPVIVAGVLGGVSALAANLISFSMIEKLNDRLPEGQRISYFWWGTNVRKRFRQLYPENNRVLALDTCLVVMLVSFVVVVRFWVFG